MSLEEKLRQIDLSTEAFRRSTAIVNRLYPHSPVRISHNYCAHAAVNASFDRITRNQMARQCRATMRPIIQQRIQSKIDQREGLAA